MYVSRKRKDAGHTTLVMTTKSTSAIQKGTAAVRIRNAAPSRQRARTEATRRKLLEAAENIFARDGFEAARLEDIAASAGYTRGAFYANFDGKEDIFFALLESWVGERILEINALLESHESPQKRLEALREHYAQFASKRRLSLLSLEFKLYAIRHPKAQARWRERNRGVRKCGVEIFNRVAGAVGRKVPVSSAAAATALGAFSQAILLENLVDPASIHADEIHHLLKLLFDAILSPRNR
jgi:AcrR family transcriptional regulator